MVFNWVLNLRFGLMMICILVGACSKKPDGKDPATRLKAYVEKSFEIKNVSEKKELEAFLTGDAKTRLAAWSEDQFFKAFIEKPRKNPAIKIREVKLQGVDQATITYELAYDNATEHSNARITHRKYCEMIKQAEIWLIRECKSIKELVEYQNELSLP